MRGALGQRFIWKGWWMKERRVRGGGKPERIHKYQRALDLAIAHLTYRQKKQQDLSNEEVEV